MSEKFPHQLLNPALISIHASSSLRSHISIFAFQSAKINKCETICESHAFGTISIAGTTAGTTNSPNKGTPAVIPVAATPTVATGMIAILAANQHFATAAPITAAPPICSSP